MSTVILQKLHIQNGSALHVVGKRYHSTYPGVLSIIDEISIILMAELCCKNL
jgi:hypothetical protein